VKIRSRLEDDVPGTRSAVPTPAVSPKLTAVALSYKMSCMRRNATVSVRELQQNLKRVMTQVEQGHVVDVTRRRRPIARLMPIRPQAADTAWPDLGARTRGVFGSRLVTPGASDAVRGARGDR
jgi:prevent-host-death family protein